MLLPLILAALPLTLAHSHPSSSHSHASTRKTISFGPSHPHAKFHLHKEPAGFAPSAARDPMEAARDVLKGLGEEGKEWRIRDDVSVVVGAPPHRRTISPAGALLSPHPAFSPPPFPLVPPPPSLPLGRWPIRHGGLS